MRKALLALPVWLQVLLMVGTTILIAFIIAIACSVFFDVDKLAANTELTSAIYQVMGTIYAILLTFTLWGVWQKFSEADASVQKEAYALLNLVYNVEASNSWQEVKIRDAALHYIDLVKQQEWPSFKINHTSLISINQHSYLSSQEIIRLIQGMHATTEREATIFGQTLVLLDSWLNARRTRILIAKGNSAEALWPLLITGAFVLFAFHGMFVAKTIAIWATLLFGFSLVIGLTFYLIFTLDAPFAGAPSISDEPFSLAEKVLSDQLPAE